MPPIRRLLIANRGEIAVRILRACREAGISPAVACSEPDCHALPAALADAVFCLGPGPATESYLRADRILDAARQFGADAIHPGYGFLSENVDFSEACQKAGIVFIGPPPQAVRLLGDKIAARRLMQSAGVPVVPGYNEDDQSAARLRNEGKQIGLPLLIKAAAGGGGRGMRVVREWSEFPALLEEARREAQAAFHDDRVLLERYIPRSRHIEFQIFGDAQGNVVHLLERECSIQRRHQKIIEETPSPILTPELRTAMGEAAVRAGDAAGYVNAGTVEFLLEESPDGRHRFYFLEVNTRLQVEHPITEIRAGIDLVRLQLHLAQGEPLPFTQEQIFGSGHVLEARIYAEDPAKGFLPSVGRLALWLEPTGPGVRVDSGVEQGSEISPYYDPMLAKLIVRGDDRAQAIARLELALRDFHVHGVTTNIAYLLAIVRHPAFQSGALSTRFLTDHFADWRPDASPPLEILLALAADAVQTGTPAPARTSPAVETGDTYTPWRTMTGWRNAR